MSFPEKRGWLFKTPYEWEDLGEVAPHSRTENGKSVKVLGTHLYCYTPVHVGTQYRDLFKFCPRCMIKMGEEES